MVGAKRFLSNRFLILSVGVAIAVVLASVSTAVAQGLTGVIIEFPGSGIIEIQNPEGVGVGEGEHTGTLRCYDGSCGQGTELQLASIPVTYDYKFKELIGLGEGFAVAGGTGVISSENGKERFAFTATIHDEGDGFVTVIYEASRRDASFVLTAPGTFTLFERP